MCTYQVHAVQRKLLIDTSMVMAIRSLMCGAESWLGLYIHWRRICKLAIYSVHRLTICSYENCQMLCWLICVLVAYYVTVDIDQNFGRDLNICRRDKYLFQKFMHLDLATKEREYHQFVQISLKHKINVLAPKLST